MIPRLDDTIVAIATPSGEGALAIVRLSGNQSIEIADRMFSGAAPLSSARGFSIHHGRARSPGGDDIDEVLALVFRAPRSFTGEDAVEFSCHGGLLVTHMVLDAARAAGARQAEPGEFTRRAFLNGRIDLSQAEAVADLIAARSDKAVRSSLDQLAGRLGARITSLKSELLDLCASLEIDLDFSEEGIDIISAPEVGRRLGQVRARLAEAAATFTGGRLLREGLSVPIVGRPNVGKSSLFNALLKESRAIVTHIPGTTRDFLEESITVSGILLRLIDTAGLRTPGDVVEAEGISRTRDILSRADIVLVVEEATSPLTTPEILDGLPPLGEFQKVVIARSKADLKGLPVAEPPAAGGSQASPDTGETPGRIPAPSPVHRPLIVAGQGDAESWGNEAGPPVVEVSSLTGTGIRELEDALIRVVGLDRIGADTTLAVTNRRHWDALRAALNSLDSAIESLRHGATNEFIAFDVHECVAALSSITGQMTSEEVLNHIFAQFCVGK
jgi:tRNA modification GTPase